MGQDDEKNILRPVFKRVRTPEEVDRQNSKALETRAKLQNIKLETGFSIDEIAEIAKNVLKESTDAGWTYEHCKRAIDEFSRKYEIGDLSDMLVKMDPSRYASAYGLTVAFVFTEKKTEL